MGLFSKMNSFKTTFLIIIILVVSCAAQTPSNTTSSPTTVTTQESNQTVPSQAVVESRHSTQRQFGRLSDVMSTLTGVLAAVGGGYLTYVGMVALFGDMLDPGRNPGYYGPSQYPYQRSSSNSLYLGSIDLLKLFRSLKEVDYPEASFKALHIRSDVCKSRSVCELESYLSRNKLASMIVGTLSRNIPGMKKYEDAIWRGSRKQNCGYVYQGCPYSLGQSLLRAIGLS